MLLKKKCSSSNHFPDFPITLTVLPQQQKKATQPKTKTLLSISYLGGGLVSLKPLTGFQHSFILRKHLLYEAWALAGTAEAWPVQGKTILKVHYYFVTFFFHYIDIKKCKEVYCLLEVTYLMITAVVCSQDAASPFLSSYTDLVEAFSSS